MKEVENVYFSGDMVLICAGLLCDIYAHGGGWGTAITLTYLDRSGRLGQDIAAIYEAGSLVKSKLYP